MVIRIYGKDDAEGAGAPLLEVTPDDTSYRHREVMGEDCLTLKFALAEWAELPVGSWCEFKGERYTLARPVSVTVHNRRSFDVTAVMEGPQWVAGIWKFRDPTDGRLTFSLTAKPSEHLRMLVENLNMRERELAGGGDGWEDVWVAGECMDADEACVCYDHHYCLEALTEMADAFGTEWEFGRELGEDGEWTGRRTVSLHRVERGAGDPIVLSYGRGNGLKADVGRSNYSDDPPVEVMYAQGGSDNIDMSRYPQEVHEADADGNPIEGEPDGVSQNHNSSKLLLPPLRMIGYDGTEFLYTDDGGDSFHYEDGDDPLASPRPYGREVRRYVTDERGYSVRRLYAEGEGPEGAGVLAEDSLDCSDICPKRVGTISGVETEQGKDDDGNPVEYYNFCDGGLVEEGLDYSLYVMAGETMTVVFQDGMLAGREFEISDYDPERGMFKVVPDEIDGMTMPGGDFVPEVGGSYAVFGVMLPNEYICSDAGHSGAEWDMLRECVRAMYDVEVQRYTITGKMDGIWSAAAGDGVTGRAVPGWYVRFTDPSVQPEPLLIRIAGVKEYINSPQSPELELSNETRSAGRLAKAVSYGAAAKDEAARARREARSLTGDVSSAVRTVTRIGDDVSDLEDTVYGVSDPVTGERGDGLEDRVGKIADGVSVIGRDVYGSDGSDGSEAGDGLKREVEGDGWLLDTVGSVVAVLEGSGDGGTAGLLAVVSDLQSAVEKLNAAMENLGTGFEGGSVGGTVGTVNPGVFEPSVMG